MTDPRRQIILVIADTLPVGLVGAYGSSTGLTPRIDQFAERGVVFEHAYTTCPLCTPARSALYTGLPAAVNGAWSLEMPTGHTVRTVAERAAAAGIHAAHIGKWHLSATDYFDTGTAPAGWDPAWWFDGRAHLESVPPDVRPRTRRRPEPNETPLAREHTFAGGVTTRAEAFLRNHSGSDFLLAVSYDEPHAPSISPRPFCERHHDTAYPVGPSARDDLLDKPRSHRMMRVDPGLVCPPEARVEGDRYFDQPFFSCTAFVDDEIGRVLDAAARYAPDALVIVTSDHGDMMGAHGLFRKGPSLYEEIVRVPLVTGLAGAGKTPAATTAAPFRCRTATSFLDLAPTILSHLGVAFPDWLPGTDLSELETRERNTGADYERGVFLEFGRFSRYNDGRGGFRPIRGIATCEHKLVLNLLDTDEFYDLARDPGETTNLIDDPAVAEKRAELHDRLLAMMDEARDPFRGPEWRSRPWRTDVTYEWTGGGRGRLADLHERPMIDYATGRERGRIDRNRTGHT